MSNTPLNAIPTAISRSTASPLSRRATLVAAMLCSLAGTASAAGVPGRGTWESTLQGRNLDGNAANGFEAYYDTTLDITWLADTHHARTIGLDPDGAGGHQPGFLRWADAVSWADGLNLYGHNDWRLPMVSPQDGVAFNYDELNDGTSDRGRNITSTAHELSHMFYVTLGNIGSRDTAGNSTTGAGFINSGPFLNTGFNNRFWYGQESLVEPGNAWIFESDAGRTSRQSLLDGRTVWLVADGDILPTAPVPEPGTWALMLAGLAGVGALARRRARAG